MTILKKTILALSLTGLAAAPIAAQAVDRTTAPIAGESEVAGGGDLVKGLIIIAIAGAGMAILLATDDDDDVPTSP